MNLSRKKIHIFPCFYLCIGSKITETVNYVIILGRNRGQKTTAKEKLVMKMQHYKFFVYKICFEFLFSWEELRGQGPVASAE